MSHPDREGLKAMQEPKPGDCRCDYPVRLAKTDSGHTMDCPAHGRWCRGLDNRVEEFRQEGLRRMGQVRDAVVIGTARPHCCPVCEGRMTLPSDFYDARLVRDPEAPVDCRSCGATGVVWG